MADNSYVYAVARVRCLEVSLFSAATIEQLLACKTYENCMAFLAEKGWGNADSIQDSTGMLKAENEKTWENIRQMRVDMSAFDVLSYQHLYHNLKAAIKEVCTGSVDANIFYDDCSVTREDMIRIIQEKDFSALPLHMQAAAREALDVMLQSKDGQLCDIIVDRASLDAIYKAGKHAKEKILKSYAESAVAIADIKIAVRAARTGKNRTFLERALAPCDTLNMARLITAALAGVDAVCEYLSSEGYHEAVEALRDSNSAFERWCDNQIIRTIQPEKYKAFTAGPLIAYVLARENEIKTVRMILTGKQNNLPEESIRERVREMYV